MALNFVRFFLRQTFSSLARNFWLAVVTSAIIAVSLAILGGFILLAVNAGQFMRNLETTVEIGVFLEEGADMERISAQLDRLEGIEEYIFVSKHEGLQNFGREIADEDVFRGLEGENNPLPDMFRVRVERAEMIPEIKEQIGAMRGVEKAEYGEELVDGLIRLTGWVNIISVGISILLAAAAVFLIVTAIRLSVLARQEEVSIMKYLGASNWFVRFPFLLEGMLIGWAGTVLAAALIGTSYYYLVQVLQRADLAFFLQPVTDGTVIGAVLLGLLVLGTLMGGIGSLISIRRFLHV